MQVPLPVLGTYQPIREWSLCSYCPSEDTFHAVFARHGCPLLTIKEEESADWPILLLGLRPDAASLERSDWPLNSGACFLCFILLADALILTHQVFSASQKLRLHHSSHQVMFFSVMLRLAIFHSDYFFHPLSIIGNCFQADPKSAIIGFAAD